MCRHCTGHFHAAALDVALLGGGSFLGGRLALGGVNGAGVGNSVLSSIERHHEVASNSLGDDVKDGVSVSLTLHRDNTSAGKSSSGFGGVASSTAGGGGLVHVGKDPDDGVANPGKGDDAYEAGVESVDDGFALDVTRPAKEALGDGDEDVKDGDESEHAEAEECPALGTSDEFANKTGGNHEDVKDDEEDLGELVATVGKLYVLVKHDGGGDDPVNVTGVVEVTAIALGGEAVAEGHGKVGKGRNGVYNTTADADLVPFVVLYVFEALAEEVKGRGEEEAEGNPEDGLVLYGSGECQWCRKSIPA